MLKRLSWSGSSSKAGEVYIGVSLVITEVFLADQNCHYLHNTNEPKLLMFHKSIQEDRQF